MATLVSRDALSSAASSHGILSPTTTTTITLSNNTLISPMTREDRIAARQNRFLVKRQQMKQQLMEQESFNNAQDAESAEKQESVSKKHTRAIRQHVDDEARKARETVTDVQLQRAATEQQRKKRETERMHARLERLDDEIKRSKQMTEEIEKAWKSIDAENVAQHLYEKIAAQYQLAASLLQKKDAVITSLQDELKASDEEFVELLAGHQRDINEIVQRMAVSFKELVTVCASALDSVEKSFLDERTALIESNKQQLDVLFEKRRKIEIQILEARLLRERKNADEIAEIRARDAEDYNALKIDLENSIQLFETQLEEMRATYQLNSEKLEYNHQILLERDLDNKTTLEHHRQKIRKLKDALNSLVLRSHKQDAKFKSKNAELTSDFKRMTEQFKDLQLKMLHFETLDTRKYDEVWRMNETAVMDVVRKVLKSDQLITQQILGYEWRCFPSANLPQAPDGSVDVDRITSSVIVEKESNLLSRDAGSGPTGNPNVPHLRYTPEQTKAVISLLLSVESFLVDMNSLDAINTGVEISESERDILRADAILSSLGIEDQEDLDNLVSRFFDPAEPNSEKPTVHQNDVDRIVREFVIARQQLKSKNFQNPVHGTIGSEQVTRKRDRDRQFWIKLGNVIDDQREQVWNALEIALLKYNSLLETRQRVIHETTTLAQENQELKALLHQYLNSKVNNELFLPPTRLLKI